MAFVAGDNIRGGNLNNVLGSRPCVRQSALFRKYESGNQVKALLFGPENATKWSEKKLQGAFAKGGAGVYDHRSGKYVGFNREAEDASDSVQGLAAAAFPPSPVQVQNRNLPQSSSVPAPRGGGGRGGVVVAGRRGGAGVAIAVAAPPPPLPVSDVPAPPSPTAAERAAQYRARDQNRPRPF